MPAVAAVCRPKISGVVVPGNFLPELHTRLVTTQKISSRAIEAASSLIHQKNAAGSTIFALDDPYFILSHFGADGPKFGRLDMRFFGMPITTAAGNDYSSPLAGLLNDGGLSEGDLLLLLNPGPASAAVLGALEFAQKQKAETIYLSDREPAGLTPSHFVKYCGEGYVGLTIAHAIMHYIGINQVAKIRQETIDRCGQTFGDFSSLVSVAFPESEFFDTTTLQTIADLFNTALSGGARIFSFGNGGSGAYSSYFCSELRRIMFGDASSSRIIDLNSNWGAIARAMMDGTYKERAFLDQLLGYGVTEADALLGASTSGSSRNITLPFENLPCTRKVAIVGYPGGALKDMATHCWVTPNVGHIIGHAAEFALKETLQMAALSFMLNYLAYIRAEAKKEVDLALSLDG